MLYVIQLSIILSNDRCLQQSHDNAVSSEIEKIVIFIVAIFYFLSSGTGFSYWSLKGKCRRFQFDHLN